LPEYRYISGPEDEGPEFLRALDDIAAFYVGPMRGRARPDGPGARMKFTRDWEYPWVFLRAAVQPGERVLDCGAGYSPLPFLWSQRGGQAFALDRDAVIASPAAYLAWCARAFMADVAVEFRRGRERGTAAAASDEGHERGSTVPASSRPQPGARRRGALARALTFHVRRNRTRLARAWRPDFWGPVSPTLLRRYRVRYLRGDLTRLPLQSGVFDAVTCVSVLEHLPHAARLAGLREMTRLLRPGGRLVLTYDLVDGDRTAEFIAASGCRPQELVYFRASERLFARDAPDVVGMVGIRS
jgi:SAM-dependent methyltransferase